MNQLSKLALSAFILLALASCGGTEDSASTAEAETGTSSTTATTAAEAESTGEPADVVAVIDGEDDLSILRQAISISGITEELRIDSDSVTVFGPTNDAFNAYLETEGLTLDELTADPAALATLLRFHVINGKVLAVDIVEEGNIGLIFTLAGETIDVAAPDGQVTVNEVPVTEADLSAENGVVHKIGQVLSLPATEAG